MKRAGLWAMKIGLVICLGISAVEQGYADEREHATTCTMATLKGRYLFAARWVDFVKTTDVISSPRISYI
jgi:hypothetical protein